LDDKIVLEVFWNSATIFGRVSNNLIFSGIIFTKEPLSKASITTKALSVLGKVKRMTAARSVGVISVVTS
jgi:hypothetical protein